MLIGGASPAAADAVRGGLLYDEYWEVPGGGPEPPDDTNHPLYPASGPQSGEATYRCKECHGWDYKGADGAYGSGSHATGIRGVFGSSKTSEEMFDLIKNPADAGGHGYGELGLSDDDIDDLVDFLRTLLIDTDQFIDGNKRFIGDPLAGRVAFTTAGTCTLCHGDDGALLNFGDDDEPEFVGTIARDNPWELLHKVRFGQPGSVPAMPSWVSSGRPTQGIADLGRYIQDNLPSGYDPARLTVKGTAKQGRGGQWKVKLAGTFETGDYSADPILARLSVDGVEYFDASRLGARNVKRDPNGKLVKFSLADGSNKANLNLKARRWKTALRDVDAGEFDPKDGVDVRVQLGNARAVSTASVTLKGKNRTIIGSESRDHVGGRRVTGGASGRAGPDGVPRRGIRAGYADRMPPDSQPAASRLGRGRFPLFVDAQECFSR
jgi:thiosulfate dehydrogenase